MAARPFILVLAGVNGAGKSSVGGTHLQEFGLTWFNPDTFARELLQHGASQEEANARAWGRGKEMLERAIASNKNFAFETTLGANTIPRLLVKAAETHDVVIWYCGLSSPEQHIARVKQRVSRGGHDIPEAKIRERWRGSIRNLIALMPRLSQLQVYDNSVEAQLGQPIPDPVLVLEMARGQILSPDPNDADALASTPSWAIPIVQAAIELTQSH